MRILKYIFIGLALSFILGGSLFAKETRQSDSEATDAITDDGLSWYAIVKVDGGKKLYTEGDIFYSDTDSTKCFRIQEVKRDTLVLKDVNSNLTYRVKPGDKLPLEGRSVVFEKSVDTSIIKHRAR